MPAALRTRSQRSAPAAPEALRDWKLRAEQLLKPRLERRATALIDRLRKGLPLPGCLERAASSEVAAGSPCRRPTGR